jgi:hypothetical protein
MHSTINQSFTINLILKFNNNIILKIKSYLRVNMDFLEELLIINNLYTLNKIADERELDDEDRIEFIKKYNKSNNRLFTPCKKYMIDDYKREVEKYESTFKNVN